jgi:spore cortex biosynthesis protein YabQ
MNITREVIVFLWFILDGIAGGVFFDMLRAIRHNRKCGDLVVYLEDILFWILLFLSAIWLTYFLDSGQIRMYMVIGIFLGMLLYFLTFTKFVYKLFNAGCRYFIRIFSFVNKITFRRATHEEKSKSD